MLEVAIRPVTGTRLGKTKGPVIGSSTSAATHVFATSYGIAVLEPITGPLVFPNKFRLADP